MSDGDGASAPALMQEIGARARRAAHELAQSTPAARTRALHAMADQLDSAQEAIAAADAEDVSAAQMRGLAAPLIDRLRLDPPRIAAMAQGLRTIAAQDDSIGAELARWTRPNGLDIARIAVPIGVIGIIFESRPNVTADAAGLCVRSGNAVILRCGSEALRSALAIAAPVQAALAARGLPADAVQIVPTTDRAAVGAMLKGLDGAIDLLIPRGGKSLVARVQDEARVPVLGHLEGLCHTYVHADADPDMAVEVTYNAKMRRTGVCGATETLLIDKSCAPALLPRIAARLLAGGCALRGDAAACALVPQATPASAADWSREYLDAILAVRVVDGLDAAIDHIARYGSQHTDAILTENADAAAQFLARVDSAIVLHNASTQFADGGEFGFGAEIGIATGKLHARGPVGAAQLTTYKYVVRGQGQRRP